METRALSKPSSVGDRLVMKEVEERLPEMACSAHGASPLSRKPWRPNRERHQLEAVSHRPISRRKRSQGSLASTVGCEDDHATVEIFARLALVPDPSAYL